MKHLKIFEEITNKDLAHKYEKYLNKFFITQHRLDNNNIFMCKMTKIKKYKGIIEYIEFEYYEFDEFEKNHNSLHIRDFNRIYKILNSFDTFEEMKKEYKLINYTKKYNL